MSKSFVQANAPVANQASKTAEDTVLAAASNFLYGRGSSVAGATAYSLLISNTGASTIHWSFTPSVTGHPIEPNQSVWLTVGQDANVYVSNTGGAPITYTYSLWI